MTCGDGLTQRAPSSDDVTRDGHQEIITHSARPVRVSHLMRGFTESSELAHSQPLGCGDDGLFTLDG